MRESDELASAFVELEALVRESSRLPGLAAAQVEARRRRGHRVAWVTAAMVVLVLAGVATVSSGWPRRAGLPVLDPTPSVTTGPTPSPSVTTDPAPTGAVLADLTPPAHIRDASLDVPEFDLEGCPSGRIQFLDGVFGSVNSGGQLVMDVAAVGDVDSDGEADVVVALACTVASGNHGARWTQVLAYSGPELNLLSPLADGAETMVTNLLVHPGGDVELGLASVSSPVTQVLAIAFDRYQWTGSDFGRIEHLDVPQDALPGSELSAVPSILELTPGEPAQRVEVTVRNDRPTSDRPWRLDLALFAPVSIEVETGVVESPPNGTVRSLLIESPRAGETVTIAVRVALPAGATLPPDSSIFVKIWGSYPSADDSALIPLILA